MFDKGFSLINILDNPNYMVPNGGGNRGAYGDYLDTKNIYNSLDPNKFGNTVLPSSDSEDPGRRLCYLERQHRHECLRLVRG